MHSRFPVIASILIILAACSSNSDTTIVTGNDGGTKDSGSPGACSPGASSNGLTLKPFCAPADPGSGGILFAASGEVLALTGYDFPPANADAPAFVDGWQVKFTRLLTTIDKITLSDNPDLVPGDESQTGPVVAQVTGPWAVDLAHADPNNLPGKGGPGEQAVPLAALSTKTDGSKFATDGTRYAFGFDVATATADAKNVNLDADAVADYQTMVQDQCAVLYVGTATFKGDKTDPTCYPDAYKTWPDTVNFRLCFKSPTTYINCQNPDNDPAKPLSNEEHPRGIAFIDSRSVIGQVTIHTDHPFWDSVLHDSPAHFDQFAARAIGQDASQDAGATPTVTLEMTKGVDFTGYTDAKGAVLNWRYCTEPPTDVHPKFTGAMNFDAQNVPRASGGDGSTGLRDYYDFATYNQSTQGHLNSDGLGFVSRNYPSPK